MWQSRCTHLLEGPQPSVLLGSPEWGMPYLIASLHDPKRPLIWLALDSRDVGDSIVQGNKLAEAIYSGIGKALFGYAMPVGYGLTVLRANLSQLGPITLALSGAEYSLEIAQHFLSLSGPQVRVILHFFELPAGLSLPKEAKLIGPEQLRLTPSEAAHLAGNQPKERVQELYWETDGAFEKFVAAISPDMSPALSRPSPGEYLNDRPLGGATEQELEHVAYQHLLRGTPNHLLERLRGMTSLPALRWRFAAALELGQEQAMLPEVESTLGQHELPELRALFAEAQLRLGQTERSIQEATLAVQQKPSVQTLYSHSRVVQTHNALESLNSAQRALHIAEQKGNAYEQVRCALLLTQTHMGGFGEYRKALGWARFALKLLREESISSQALRLEVLNEWAFLQMLTHSTDGLAAHLRTELEYTHEVYPRLAWLFRSTLADVLLAAGQTPQALELYQELWENVRNRYSYGMAANLMVRALLDNDNLTVAREHATYALHITEDLPMLYRRRALLAQGMILAIAQPKAAIEVLKPVLESFSQVPYAPRMAQTALYLAKAYLEVGESTKAKAVLERTRPAYEQLGLQGLHYLAGPKSAFEGVLQLVHSEPAALELFFLGRPEARYLGKPLDLRRRHADLLLALAQHPDGLSAERLSLMVYGEEGASSTAKSDLSRLRSLLPIESRPYRIATSVWADFLEVPKLLREGRISEALQYYKGPLLPESKSPLVADERLVLEESLRLAILASKDPDAVFGLAERLGMDLEVWETALELLPPQDHRRSQAQAQRNRISRDWQK